MKFPESLRFSAHTILALTVAGLVSCQSTDPGSGTPPTSYNFALTVSRATLRPDSASWTIGSTRGGALLTHDSSTLNNAYRAKFDLPRPLGTDTLHLLLWRSRMLTGDFPLCLVKDNLERARKTGRDTVASLLLDRLANLATDRPDAYPIRADSSLAKIFAVFLVEGSDSLFRTGLRAAPAGLDTSRVRRDALIHAASLGRPLTAIAAGWFLGMDSAAAREAVLALMPKYIPYGDTESLFPLPPVRVVAPLSLSGNLFSDSTSISVKGIFAAKKRLIGPYFRVLDKDGLDQMGHFDIDQERTPGLVSTTWNLSADGGLTLRAFGNAAPGTYTLRLWMKDVDGRTDTARASFEILPRPDRTGPTLQRLSPTQDAILNFGDSVVLLRIGATDTSGVASVVLGGRSFSLAGGEWTLSDTIPATGVWTERTVRATDRLGNESQLVFRFLRTSNSTTKPVIALVEPAKSEGDTIPATQETRRVSWRVTDPAGLSLVTIGGKNATETDSVWSADVPIPSTGTATTVLLQALNRNGNGVIDSVRVVRRKDAKPPVFTRLAGTRTLFFDSTSARVVWKVSDDLRLDSIWINGTFQAPRSDSLYGLTLATLAVGTNPVHLCAKDFAGNVSADTQTVTRLPNQKPPVLKRLVGTSDQIVAYGTDSIAVRWLASGNEPIDSVVINGRRALNKDDTFALKIALAAGPMPVVAKAWNHSGNTVRDSITIESRLKDKDGNLYRIRTMPDKRVWMTQNLRALPATGTASCALSNCEQNGALYDWSQATARAGTFDSLLFGSKDTSTVQGLCPAGWHIAKPSEWSALFKATKPASTTDSGKALRSDTGWADTGWATWGGFVTPSGNYTTLLGLRTAPAETPTGEPSATSIISPPRKSERRAQFWLPGESDARAGTIQVFRSGSAYGSTLTKTSGAVVRCIEDGARVVRRIPLNLFDPVFTP